MEGLGGGLCNECLLSMPIKPRRLIELESGLVFAACEKHDLVAADRPSVRERVSQDCLAVPLISMACVSDDILDDPIGPAAACEIWDHCKRAARHKLISEVTPVVPIARVAKKFLPDGLDLRLRR